MNTCYMNQSVRLWNYSSHRRFQDHRQHFTALWRDPHASEKRQRLETEHTQHTCDVKDMRTGRDQQQCDHLRLCDANKIQLLVQMRDGVGSAE